MSERRTLVRVELSFVTSDDPDGLGDRIKESVAQIVGRDALDEFRIRTSPMDPKKRGHLRTIE